MKFLIPFTLYWLALAGCALVQSGTTVNAMVASRPRAGADLGAPDRVAVLFTLRAPTELRGAQFDLVTLATQQAEVEKLFPFQGLWEIQLTRSTIQDLKEQIAAKDSIDRQVKAGSDPVMISQIYSIPAIRSETLPAAPRIARIQP